MARPHYRRRKDSDTWHFCTNCGNWPKRDYEDKWSKPTSGEFCNQCQGKEENKDKICD